MRVLLKQGTEQMTAATILTLPGGKFEEAVLETLSGQADTRGGFVAEASDAALARAVSAAARERHYPTVTARGLFEDVRWMARILAPYVIGFRVLLHVTPTGCRIDCSRAIRVGGLSGESDRGNGG